MKCDKASQLFSDYYEKTLYGQEKEDFEAHLKSCEDCALEYKKFASSLSLIESLDDVELPSNFHAQVMARIQQTAQTNKKPLIPLNIDWKSVFSVRSPIKALAYGLSVLVLLSVLIQVSPIDTITAGWFTPKPSITNNQSQNISSLPITGETISPKVSVVDIKEISENNYEIQLASGIESIVDYTITDSKSNIISEDSISRHTNKFINVATSDKNTEIFKINWQNDGKKHTSLIIVPSAIDKTVDEKLAAISIESMTLEFALAEIAKKYNVAFFVQTGYNKNISVSFDKKVSVDEALNVIANKLNLKVSAASPGVYVIDSK
ncbi:MAG: zf-HC2 domain-containing protein [Armatimonadota bacterium]